MSADFDEQLIAQLFQENTKLDQTAPAVFKTVFAVGRQTEFLKALSTFAGRKDGEIEKLCHQHALNFVKSIDELLGLREQARKLRLAVVQVQEELARCGQLLYDTKVEIYETEKMLYNTERLVAAMGDCLQVLNMAQQATLEVIDQNFSQALRLTEQLQTSYLARIEEYSFASKLHQWIPAQLATVRNFALEELKMWLSKAREQTPQIGAMAFNKSQKRIEKWRELYDGMATPTSTNVGLSHRREVSSATAYVDLVEMEREDASMILSKEQKVDFEPLLKAVHLFDIMKRSSEFQSLFAEYRRAQANVIFEMQIVNFTKDSEAKSFAMLLHHICGFFILEYFILRKPQKFYSPTHVDGLWEYALNLINNSVMEALGKTNDQSVLIKIKWLLVFFFHSIEIYDIFSISSMLETIISLFYRFVDLAKVEYCQRIEEASSSCNLKPLSLSSATMLTRMKKQFEFIALDKSVDSMSCLPFSSFVLEVYNSIADFINNFYIFLDGVPQQSGELEEIVKKKVDALLLDAVKAHMERLLATDLDGAVQIVQDFHALTKICADIAKLLAVKRKSGGTTVTLQSVEHVEKASHDAEAHLFKLINKDIDKLFATNPLNYSLQNTPSQPSILMLGFKTYFEQTRNRFGTLLPPTSNKQLSYNILSHLATKLTDCLYDKNVVSINMNFIEQICIDLGLVENIGKDQLQQDNLALETFAELKQLITLLKADKVHEFLDPIVRNRKYPSLRSNVIVQILQKIKEPASKRREFEDLILLL